MSVTENKRIAVRFLDLIGEGDLECVGWVVGRREVGSHHHGGWRVAAGLSSGPPGTSRRSTAMTATLVPTLAALVEQLDEAVRAPRAGLDVPHAVGEALRPFLGCTGILTPEQEAGDPLRYRTHLLHVPDDGAYSLVAAVWRPGQGTPCTTTSRGASSACTAARSTRSATASRATSSSRTATPSARAAR